MKTWLLLVDYKFQAIGDSFWLLALDSDYVYYLKKKVKEERQNDLAHVDAARLTVWKTKGSLIIHNPSSKRLQEILGSIDVDDEDTIEELSPQDRVTDLGLSHDQILLIQLPAVTSNEDLPETVQREERAHIKAIEMAKTAPAPSSVSNNVTKFKTEQDKRPIYNGRPALRRGPPVAIYHKVFAELKDALRDPMKVVDRAEEERVKHTAKLFLAATDIYDNENDRYESVVDPLEKLLGVTFIAKPDFGGSSFQMDAAVVAPVGNDGGEKAIIGCVEFKNELGVGGDCELQNGLRLRKHLARNEYDGIRNACCCPCITISVAGPYLSIGGAIFVDVFAVESFTDYVYLGGNPYAQERIIHYARIFAAVAQAFLGLKRFYQHLKRKDTQSYRLFPSPTYFADKKPQNELTFTSRFEYEGWKSDDHHRSLFRATYGDGEKVLVKFCDQYHGHGHRIVSEANYAPDLFFCERIQGGVTMVIVKLITTGEDAHYRFMDEDLPSDILDDVRAAVGLLHDAGLVFGDLRRSNIIIDTSGDCERALLIDFEWVGLDGQARYPALLNDSGEIAWPPGVKPHVIMRKEHDIEMIGKLNVYY